MTVPEGFVLDADSIAAIDTGGGAAVSAGNLGSGTSVESPVRRQCEAIAFRNALL